MTAEPCQLLHRRARDPTLAAWDPQRRVSTTCACDLDGDRQQCLPRLPVLRPHQ
jgi:hypothetical protein